VGGKPVSIHAEGERVILTGPAGTRQEIDLAADAARPEPELPEPICPAGAVASAFLDEAEPAPGTSPLDDGLQRLAEALGMEVLDAEPADDEPVDAEPVQGGEA
jgi:hypothetical protein